MSNDLREIVTRLQMDQLCVLLAVLLPLAGAAIWAARARKLGRRRAFPLGLVVALVGPVNLALWLIYNAITDRLGLDRVSNLLVNLALFVGLGVGIGLGAAFWARRNAAAGTTAR